MTEITPSYIELVHTPKDRPLHQRLQAYASGTPTEGGAKTHYYVTDSGLDPKSVQRGPGESLEVEAADPIAVIPFHRGPLIDNVPVGLTNEVLLAIVAHRLEAFQAGPFACEANLAALVKVRSAIHDLQSRTEERLDRGVEGTPVP